MSVLHDYFKLNVLVTGDTGFKGAWLTWWLTLLGANVTGFALPVSDERNIFQIAKFTDILNHVDGDVRDIDALTHVVRETQPNIIFHLAAQALVRDSYVDPLNTLSTNIIGTANVLEAVRRENMSCAVVVVTSDKCYQNREWVYSYRENDPMGGHDPYSASKGCAELITDAYSRSFFQNSNVSRQKVPVACARAGNVIGPGDWAPNRILPDAISALIANRAINVRNPNAIRPWQHVLEPLSGYLVLGTKLLSQESEKYHGGWNLGPRPESARSVANLVKSIIHYWGEGNWESQLNAGGPYEANMLRLSIDRAVSELNWTPVWGFDRTIELTVRGYRDILQNLKNASKIREILDKEIELYSNKAAEQCIDWAI